MLVTNLHQTLHCILPNVGIFLLKRLKNLLHNKVAFFLDLEVLFHVRDTVNESLYRKLAQRGDFLVARDITGQRQHDQVFCLFGQVTRIQVLANVAECLERGESDFAGDVHVLGALTQLWDEVFPFLARNFYGRYRSDKRGDGTTDRARGGGQGRQNRLFHEGFKLGVKLEPDVLIAFVFALVQYQILADYACHLPACFGIILGG